MKKIISIVLAVMLLMTVAMPAMSAAAANERTPVVYIRGNGDGLYYPDGRLLVAQFEDLDLSGEGGINKDVVVETAVNILKPFVLEGMLFDKWDNYGKAIYDEISPLFENAGLDENGDPKADTGVHTKQ